MIELSLYFLAAALVIAFLHTEMMLEDHGFAHDSVSVQRDLK